MKTSTKIPQIWHPYWLWEENKHNMWGGVDDKEKYLKEALEFMQDTKLFGKWMRKVVMEWKYSCEHNLTCTGSNRKSWLGQAASAFALKCSEDITREAWGYLNKEEQERANEEAQKAILIWEKKFIQDLCQKSI